MIDQLTASQWQEGIHTFAVDSLEARGRRMGSIRLTTARMVPARRQTLVKEEPQDQTSISSRQRLVLNYFPL